MKYVFGPVPSRRLGKSLGIDPIPLKTCNWNCVYCQLGRTRPLTNVRREYVPYYDIINELNRALAANEPDGIDWVTFVGSGEPTLHSRLGKLIREIKTITKKPVAVITNGSLLYMPEVREQLMIADAVLPSLDAGNPHLYRKINRPWPQLTFQRLIEGLAAFRREYKGNLWVEVMLVREMNDNEEALSEIASILNRIRPDQVHINLPSRPPAEEWVHPAANKSLKRAQSILGERSKLVSLPNLDIQERSSNNLSEAIMSIITRHPMPEEELLVLLQRWSPNEVHTTLETLTANGQAQIVVRYGTSFWSSTGAYFPIKED
jgi:wyosine [tRNA(Phe)-imidazoG37] synthetase (radical SAM superfamily)